jgi:hypothetical protein
VTLVRMVVMRKKWVQASRRLLFEEAEQDHDARADAEKADDDVDEHQWRHAHDHDCGPPRGERVRAFEADTIHEKWADAGATKARAER